MRTTPFFFRDWQQVRLFFMLLLASACCALLVAVRIIWKWHELPEAHSLRGLVTIREFTFTFLIWNLFLAWIPYVAALWISRQQRQGAGWVSLCAGLLVWLVFLPNAPYIVTDFIHFRAVPSVPLWYDLVLLFASASTGLLLGLLSLREVHFTLKRWLPNALAGSLVFISIGLAGFGVWLGRFQRWNSWDLVTRPHHLLSDIVNTLSQRHELLHAAGVSALLSGILLVGYGILFTLLEKPSSTL